MADAGPRLDSHANAPFGGAGACEALHALQELAKAERDQSEAQGLVGGRQPDPAVGVAEGQTLVTPSDAEVPGCRIILRCPG